VLSLLDTVSSQNKKEYAHTKKWAKADLI
jgi:hypothetical protein